MGREGPLDNNYSMQLTSMVADRALEKDKEEIQTILEFIDTTKDKKEWDNSMMKHLFHYWAKYIPQHAQSIKCGGCRQAVLQFWKKVNQEWNK